MAVGAALAHQPHAPARDPPSDKATAFCMLTWRRFSGGSLALATSSAYMAPQLFNGISNFHRLTTTKFPFFFFSFFFTN
jgi:hypothetical protein